MEVFPVCLDHLLISATWSLWVFEWMTHARTQLYPLFFLRGDREDRAMIWGQCPWPQANAPGWPEFCLGLIHMWSIRTCLELSVLLFPSKTPLPLQDLVEVPFFPTKSHQCFRSSVSLLCVPSGPQAPLSTTATI